MKIERKEGKSRENMEDKTAKVWTSYYVCKFCGCNYVRGKMKIDQRVKCTQCSKFNKPWNQNS